MPSLEELESVPIPSHRSSVGSLDESSSETSGPAGKKSSCASSSSSSCSPANTNPTAMLPDQKSLDSAGLQSFEQIAHQLGILSILDHSETAEENNPDSDLTPVAHPYQSSTTGFMIPKSSYRSDSGASSGGDFSLEGSPPTFGHQGGFAYGGYGGAPPSGGPPFPSGLAEYVEYPGSFNDGEMPLRLEGGVNVTENVPVPSSEHVAEIVGRQGCKIKALRAKTNTYIKTPVRGEEPSFVVTGRRADVEAAKLEILNAADHFTQIRASRRHSQGGAPAPGHITAYVRVPYRVVGLVVGPKGATIKRIQQDTHTYIITPSRDREPVFEVTGLPDNVERARREIEMHIYMRTGNLPITNGYDASHHAAAAAAAAQAVGYEQGQGSTQNGAVADWSRFAVAGGNTDFHLNGNDVQFNGEVPQVRCFQRGSTLKHWVGNPVISKPPSFSFGMDADCVTVASNTAAYERPYPTWSTGGLVPVEPSEESTFPDLSKAFYSC